MAQTDDDRGLESDEILSLVREIENELTKNYISRQNPESLKVLKSCVFYIILRAISMSKDPKTDKRSVMVLYEVAREIIINSNLEEDVDAHTYNRLQDLINAIIDGDDISVQLKSFSSNNKQWIDSRTAILETKLDTLIKGNASVQAILSGIESKTAYGRRGRIPGLLAVVITGTLGFVFTIIVSVVIISTILTSAINNEGLTATQKQEKYMQQQNYDSRQ